MNLNSKPKDELKKIEDYLECNLEILIKAQCEGVFYKDKNGNIELIGKPEWNEHLFLDFKNKCFRYLSEPMLYSNDCWREFYDYDLSFKNYRITWALTKEDFVCGVD